MFTSKIEVAPLYMGYNSKDEEIVIYVKETGNPQHEKTQRKYGKLLEKSRKNRKRHRAIMAKIVAESIIDTWKGVLDKEGNVIEPTLENKVDALVSFKKLFFEVLDFASDSSNYQEDEDDDDDIQEEEDDVVSAEDATEKN
ncbi:MAG: hypothetical protein DRI97_04450 [Bacteroidetes bacterium]|nr:MAG: hypothetical protein DRI97_04450 [Bacteroidota bacterium]